METEEKTIQDLINEQWNIIHDREALLSTKDYIGVKIAMGVATIEEYADEIAQTEVWRQDVRDAYDEIDRLTSGDDEEVEPDGEEEAEV